MLDREGVRQVPRFTHGPALPEHLPHQHGVEKPTWLKRGRRAPRPNTLKNSSSAVDPVSGTVWLPPPDSGATSSRLLARNCVLEKSGAATFMLVLMSRKSRSPLLLAI